MNVMLEPPESLSVSSSVSFSLIYGKLGKGLTTGSVGNAGSSLVIAGASLVTAGRGGN
jgi:hypothetical protein